MAKFVISKVLHGAESAKASNLRRGYMRFKVLFFVAVAFFLPALLFGGQLTKVVSFSEEDLSFSKVDGYDLVKLRDHPLLAEPANPLLPVVSFRLLIPPTAEITEVEVVSTDILELPGEYLIHPGQEPRPISAEEVPLFVEPDEAIYSSSSPYPGEIAGEFHTGSMGGYRIGSLKLYPIQYIPSQKAIRLHTRIELKVVYKEGVVSPKPRTDNQRRAFRERVRRMVANPEDVDRWAPPLTDAKQGSREYVIITTDPYVSTLQQLADWKTKKGVPTEVKTVAWINTNHGGHYDTQENVREFLKEYHADSGLIWVLLAGDISVVPHRIARVVTPQATANIPCDLYFSDLDGDWDANGNHVYGEPADNVDMYSDVYVGRASIDNASQASTFLSKVLAYEKNPPTAHLKKICLPAVMLWPGYNGDVVNDFIANYTPGGWQDSKLYESRGNLSRTILRDSLNAGFQFCHTAAHGDPNGWYYWLPITLFDSQDAYGLNNGNELAIVNSIACITGGFDQGSYNSDCLAENFVNNPNGGAVAAIMNSREGWGTPPSMGPSEQLDARFYAHLFQNDIFQIGETNAAAKDDYVTQGRGDPYWRWCIFQLNLFGDPDMPMWTEIPQSMTVDHPQSVPPGPQSFTVTLTHSGTPIENGLVCVTNSTIYEHGYTNSSGLVTFSIDPLAQDTISVTATAYNFYPYEGECLVQVGVEETSVSKDQLPMTKSQLFQNRPNPFGAGGTTISFNVKRSTLNGSLEVYDLGGRLVRTLVDEPLAPGYHSVGWDGKNSSGEDLAAGVYFCRLISGEFTAVKKMVVLR